MFLMKKVFIILILIIAATEIVARQTIHRETNVTEKNKREVMKVEHRWNRAFLRRDIKTLTHILAGDYVGTTNKGEVQSKTEELIALKAAAPNFVSFGTDGVEVHVYEDVAIVTGRMRLTVLYEEQEVSGEFLYTRVYVERHRHWRLVVSHTNKLEQ